MHNEHNNSSSHDELGILISHDELGGSTLDHDSLFVLDEHNHSSSHDELGGSTLDHDSLFVLDEHNHSSNHDELGGSTLDHDSLFILDERNNSSSHDELGILISHDELGGSTLDHDSLFVLDEHNSIVIDDRNSFFNHHHDAEHGEDAIEFFDPAAVDCMFQDLNEPETDIMLSADKTVEAISNTLKGLGPIDADVESMIEPFDAVVTPEDLKKPPSHFVHMFARIQAVGEGLREQREHPPGSGKKFWFVKCPNHDLGCKEEMVGPKKIQTHYLVCPYNDPSYVEKEPEFSCPRDDCDRSFTTKKKLKDHLADHDYVPKQCSKRRECKIEDLFPTRTTLATHGHKHHGKFRATRCTYTQCLHTKVYDVYSSLKLHLKADHGLLTAAEQNPYVYPHLHQQVDDVSIDSE
jgi:hypothetical protein